MVILCMSFSPCGEMTHLNFPVCLFPPETQAVLATFPPTLKWHKSAPLGPPQNFGTDATKEEEQIIPFGTAKLAKHKHHLPGRLWSYPSPQYEAVAGLTRIFVGGHPCSLSSIVARRRRLGLPAAERSLQNNNKNNDKNNNNDKNQQVESDKNEEVVQATGGRSWTTTRECNCWE